MEELASGKNNTVENKESIKQMGHISYLFTRWLICIVVNIAINGAFGFAGRIIPFFFAQFPDPTPAYGSVSMVTDTIWMTLFLGLFLSFFETQITYEEVVRKKIVKIPDWDRKSIPIIKHFPDNPFWRSVFFAICTFAIFLPLFIGIIYLLQIESLPFWHWVVFKGLYAGFMAMFLGPIVRITALGDKKYTSGDIDVRLFQLLYHSLKIKRS
jgi:hypothetical protein